MLFLLAGLAAAEAITLDWNSVDWTAATTATGGSTQSFDIDPDNPGNDITITITVEGSDGELNTGGNSINDSTTYTGGFGTDQESLRIGADHNGTNAAIRVTITFHYTNGVNNVQFSLLDVDTNDNNGDPNPNQFRDQVDEFTGENNGSTVISAATLTREDFNNDDTTANRARGDNDGNNNNNDSNDVDRESGQHDDDGNVGVAYGSTTVDEVSFRWINYQLEGQQAIALGDITYDVVIPEPSTYLGGTLLILLASHHYFRKRRRGTLDVS